VVKDPPVKVATDLLVKAAIADPVLRVVNADLALRVVTDLLVKVATDLLVNSATDLLVISATDLLVISVTEEEVAQEVDTEVPVAVLNSLQTQKVALM
jgi:hypothetical protein